MALDQPDPDPALDIELVTASLRADASDLGAFVEALAVKLEEALPNGVRVDRRGGLFGAKKVRQITVDAGDTRLRLDRDGAKVTTSRARLSGGIVLKTERVDTDEWLRELGRELAEQARSSQVTREALERMLEA
jgi:hypothetical protein